MSRTSFGKLQREKDRRERAAAKAEKRAQRTTANDDAPAGGPSPEEEARLLEELAALHARFDDGAIDFETFSDARDQITRKLQVG
jgi:hypothetical protein